MVTAEVDDRSHVDGPVGYNRVAPLGGPHAPAWANCGFYADQGVPAELAVNSMEHGAVWIAYPEDGDVDTERPTGRARTEAPDARRPHGLTAYTDAS